VVHHLEVAGAGLVVYSERAFGQVEERVFERVVERVVEVRGVEYHEVVYCGVV